MTKSATTEIPHPIQHQPMLLPTPPRSKLVAPITQDPADGAKGEPASEDAIASETSEPTMPATIEVPTPQPTTSGGEDSSDSETGDAEREDSSDSETGDAEREDSSDSETGDAERRPSRREDDDDSVGREGIEDEMDALTRGFEQQAFISHSTYLQTAEGEVIAAGSGFTVRPGYYVSKSGNAHDTTQPPPGVCFNCHGDHWRKDCPWGVRI